MPGAGKSEGNTEGGRLHCVCTYYLQCVRVTAVVLASWELRGRRAGATPYARRGLSQLAQSSALLELLIPMH